MKIYNFSVKNLIRLFERGEDKPVNSSYFYTLFPSPLFWFQCSGCQEFISLWVSRLYISDSYNLNAKLWMCFTLMPPPYHMSHKSHVSFHCSGHAKKKSPIHFQPSLYWTSFYTEELFNALAEGLPLISCGISLFITAAVSPRASPSDMPCMMARIHLTWAWGMNQILALLNKFSHTKTYNMLNIILSVFLPVWENHNNSVSKKF
jgi:hypothetical protein